MKNINWSQIKGIILDMDGVIYNGDTSIKSAIKAIKIWQDKNLKVCFLTNNSTKNQLGFVKKLKSMNLYFNKESIISTGICTANYLFDNYNNKTKVYIVGSNSLKKTILNKNFLIDEQNAKVVIVGLDQKFTYKKLKIASSLLRKGAQLIGTNSDKIYPTDKGFMPGAGTIIESIRSASMYPKCYFIGKPNPYFVNAAIKYLNFDKKNIILIGDQLETDILAANKAKISSVLVNTGVKNKNIKIKPTIVVNSLMELPLSKNK